MYNWKQILLHVIVCVCLGVGVAVCMWACLDIDNKCRKLNLNHITRTHTHIQGTQSCALACCAACRWLRIFHVWVWAQLSSSHRPHLPLLAVFPCFIYGGSSSNSNNNNSWLSNSSSRQRSVATARPTTEQLLRFALQPALLDSHVGHISWLVVSYC